MERLTTSRQIGAAVRDSRREAGLTQQQLADRAGVSRPLVSRLEAGTSTAIYPEKLFSVMHALGLELFILKPDEDDAAVPHDHQPSARIDPDAYDALIAQVSSTVDPSLLASHDRDVPSAASRQADR